MDSNTIHRSQLWTAVTLDLALWPRPGRPNAATKIDWASTTPDHLKFFDTHKADIDKFQADLRTAIGLPARR